MDPDEVGRIVVEHMQKQGETNAKLEANVVEIRNAILVGNEERRENNKERQERDEAWRDTMRSYNDNFFLHTQQVQAKIDALHEKINLTSSNCAKWNGDDKKWYQNIQGGIIIFLLGLILVFLGIREFAPGLIKLMVAG